MGQEPCLKSGVQTHICLMEGELVHPALRPRVTQQDTASSGLCVLLQCTLGCGFREHKCLKSGPPVGISSHPTVGVQLFPDSHCWHTKSQRRVTWTSG